MYVCIYIYIYILVNNYFVAQFMILVTDMSFQMTTSWCLCFTDITFIAFLTSMDTNIYLNRPLSENCAPRVSRTCVGLLPSVDIDMCFQLTLC